MRPVAPVAPIGRYADVRPANDSRPKLPANQNTLSNKVL